MHMNKRSTKDSSVKRIRIDRTIQDAFDKRNKALDNADPDIPVLPPGMWDNAIIGKYYRPKKTPISPLLIG